MNDGSAVRSVLVGEMEQKIGVAYGTFHYL